MNAHRFDTATAARIARCERALALSQSKGLVILHVSDVEVLLKLVKLNPPENEHESTNH